MDKIPQGSRKVVLTKWMLSIFTVGTGGYMGLAGYNGFIVPDSFYMNFVLGLGLIGGAFTAGNIFEHRAKADISRAMVQARIAESTGRQQTPEHTAPPKNKAEVVTPARLHHKLRAAAHG